MTPFRSLGRVVVPVADQDAALAFYHDVLGFEVLHDETTDGFRFLHVGLPGEPGVGAWLFPGEPTRDRPHLVLYSDDLDATRDRLTAHGVEIWAERDGSASRSLHFRDPSGNVLIAAELRG